ncbi:pilus assembly FimT family protein [Rhodocyclaceae bacterium SMB388]
MIGPARAHLATARHRRRHGFTLVEMVVALGIAALMLATVPTAVTRAFDTMAYRSTVRHLLTDLKRARLHALHSGQATVFAYEPQSRRFGVGEQLKREVPPKLAIAMIVADTEVVATRAGIRFYADGGASGGSIDVIRPSGDGVRISVDWLLGRARQQAFDASERSGPLRDARGRPAAGPRLPATEAS